MQAGTSMDVRERWWDSLVEGPSAGRWMRAKGPLGQDGKVRTAFRQLRRRAASGRDAEAAVPEAFRPKPTDGSHLRHRKRARAGAARAAGQGPIAGNGFSADGARERERIARRSSRCHGHAERAVHLAAEISTQREGSGFGFAGNKARRVGRKLEVRNVQRSIGIDGEGRAKREDGSVVAVTH